MIVTGTGHRPNKLGGYSAKAFKKLVNLASEILVELKPNMVISGMALGWDQALATAAILNNIPFTAAIPFQGQQNAWPDKSRVIFSKLLEKASKQVVICKGNYAAWKMQKRNEWMVDNSDIVIALWDGSSGGTANCISYANKIKKKVINCWSKFVLQ